MKRKHLLPLLASCLILGLMLTFLLLRAVRSMPPPLKLWTVGFSADGQTLVTGGGHGAPAQMPQDGELIFWDAKTGTKKRIVRTSWGIRSLACSPDGRFIVVGDFSGATRLVHPATGKTLRTLMPHSALVNAVAVSRDGKLVASGSFDGTVILSDATGKQVATLVVPNEQVLNVAISPDCGTVVATTRSGKAYLFDVVQTREPKPVEACPQPPKGEAFVEAVAFAPDGGSFVTGCGTFLRLWETKNATLLRDLQGCTAPVLGAAISPDGQSLAAVESNGLLMLWDPESGQLAKTVQAHAGASFAIAFSPNGRSLATAGVNDFTLRVWRAQTLDPAATYYRAKLTIQAQ